jgi:O-succinylbenzoic acid--CoA ligase
MDPVRTHAQERPDATAVVTAEGEMSWSVLDEQVDVAAARLSDAGADPRDVVAVNATTDLRTIIVVHAAWRLGIGIAPLHPGLTASEREGAMAVLDAFDPSQADGQPTTAAIVWTSGSTGAPRGVALPHRSFAHNAKATAKRLSLVRADRWLTTLSLAHVGGVALVARAAHVGSAIVLSDGFSAKNFHQQCSDGNVTHTSLVPTMLSRLVAVGEPAPSSLLAVLIGGAAAPPALVERALELGYPVALTYGMSEAGSQIATATPEQTQAHPNSVGAPLDGVEVVVDDSGQILVRGPTLATHLVGDGKLAIDAEGWLHTGDFGVLDDGGELHVGGRLDGRLITGGVNVDPVEVERVLARVPGVARACVVGLPDPEWGERVEAGVTLIDPSATPPTSDSVRELLKETLSAAKIPKRIHVLQSFPVGRNGKMDRSRVRDILAAAP